MKVRVLKREQPIRQAFGMKLMMQGCYLPSECWPPFEWEEVNVPLTSQEFIDLTMYERKKHLEPWMGSK